MTVAADTTNDKINAKGQKGMDVVSGQQIVECTKISRKKIAAMEYEK